MAGILMEGDTVTPEQRAAFTREVMAKERPAAMKRAAEMKTRVGDSKLRKAIAIEGRVISDEIVESGSYRAKEVSKGEHLRIIDLEGRQAVDFLCYDLKNLDSRYNAANTIKLNKSIYVGKGFKLYSDTVESLFTVVEDTVGFHDTIGGCCSTEVNFVRYGITEVRSCRRNFISALHSYDRGARDIPANINFFMYVPVKEDGTTAIVDGRSEPGDYVDLCADKDSLAVLSNCPQQFNDANGWIPTPIRLIHWTPY